MTAPSDIAVDEAETAAKTATGSDRPGVIKRVSAWGTRVWERISAWSLVAHVIRALERFNDRLGNQFAAAITYFSLLSLVPILMVAFSVAGFVLADRPEALAELKDHITELIPGDLSTQIGLLIDRAVNARFTIGIIGLLVALYSGIGWMSNIRHALRAIWSPVWNRSKDKRDNIILAYLKDLGLLAGLGLAILISFGLSTLGNAMQSRLVGWLGLDNVGWIAPLLTLATLAIATIASLLIFMWVYGRLPPKEYRAPWRPLLIGSIAAALVFEVLKSAFSLLIRLFSGSASAVVFGSVIGLLIFINIIAKMFLMIGSWIATDSHTPGGLVPIEPDEGASKPAEQALPRAERRRPAVAPTQSTAQQPANSEHEAPVAAALGVGLIIGWLIGRRGASRR